MKETSTTSRLLALVAALLAMNLVAMLAQRPRGAGSGDLWARAAQAQGVVVASGGANKLFTVGRDGATIYVWEDDGRGWKATKYDK